MIILVKCMLNVLKFRNKAHFYLEIIANYVYSIGVFFRSQLYPLPLCAVDKNVHCTYPA